MAGRTINDMMRGDYYDIDDILAEATPVPCTFNYDADELGFLNDGSDEKDIKKHTAAALPFWLAAALHLHGNPTRQFVTYTLPPTFDDKYMGRILADPKAIDFAEDERYWYELGSKLVLGVSNANASQLASRIAACLLVRYTELLHYTKATSGNFIAKLANAESNLWDLKTESEALNKKWKSQRMTTLFPSYVTNIAPEQSSASASLESGAAAAVAAPSASGAGAIARAADAASRKRKGV